MGDDEARSKRNTHRGFGPPRPRGPDDIEPEPAHFTEESGAPLGPAPVFGGAALGGSVQVGGAAAEPRTDVRPDVPMNDAPRNDAKNHHVKHDAKNERALARRGQPAVDIDLIHERRTAPLPDHEWTFVEIWTRNTIYALDSRLVCIAVIDQNTRRSHPDHALLGARLVGGQQRDGESMELSHPFPRPGSEAVFEQSKGRQVRFSQTSTVTRVVLRLRVLTVASDNLLPTWEEITGHGEPPGRANRG